jgi:prepilin-type N-terminal cleavage/methylation domain-containing protein
MTIVMKPSLERGFTLIELAITVLVLGILFAFSVPAFQSLSGSYQLHGATENFAAQLRLAREKAIATGVEQPMHIPSAGIYHIHYPTGIAAAWTTPNGISIVSTTSVWYRMERDGRCKDSGLVIMRDRRGNQDTVSVQLSGLVLTK